MNTAMIVFSTVLAAVTIWSVVCVVNHMNSKTPFLRRLAFILLGTGAAGMLISPFYLQKPPEAVDVLILLALAIMSFTERGRLYHRRPATHP